MTMARIRAGDFAAWFHKTGGNADVPCGSCTGCCRSSMFIHIKPDETRALARIPKQLLFPAPGQPKGHVLLGYNERGECPMLVANHCSIYADRPQTCRDFDCRVYAAAGTAPDGVTQSAIADRVRAWEFELPDAQSRREFDAVGKSAAFLAANDHLFPEGLLPKNPAQRALVAMRTYQLFLEGALVRSDAELAAAIVRSVSALAADRGS